MERTLDRDSLTAGLGVERGLVNSLLTGAVDWAAFCQHLLARAAERLKADAAELFLRDLQEGDLVLEASHRLNTRRERVLRLAAGEGVTGSALQHPGGVIIPDRHNEPAARHPADFSATPLPSMMAVWLGETESSTGMLVLYREGVGRFTQADLAEANALAKRLEVMLDFGSVVASHVKPQMARQLGQKAADTGLRTFRGKMVAPGRCLGAVSIHRHENAADLLEHERMARGADAADPGLLERAIARARDELARDRDELRRLIPEAALMLFDAHEMMLQDEHFTDKMRRAVAAGAGVAQAIGDAAAEYIRIFESSQHEHVREKARDIEDLALRLLDNLAEARPAAFGRGRIIVARLLRPSEIVRIARANVGGVVLCSGGATAHIALLVKSLGIPTMIARSNDVMRLTDGLPALLNATDGMLLANPTEEVKNVFLQRAQTGAAPPGPLPPGGVFTRDGVRVTTLANVNLLSEIKPVLDLRADGIGLYRTEIAYLVRDTFPGEHELAELYKNFFALADGIPVTVRTLDAGSDKFIEYLHGSREDNPALGLRSIRLTLRHPDILLRQLRALLRAAAGRPGVKLMFPMISSLDEFRAARALYEKARADVEAETGAPCGVKTGMMVELPAAAELAPEFAREADFFSIGTNDFIQYMLAADRANAEMMEYFTPHAPAVLRGLKRVASAARDAGIECSVCGEMGHDPCFIPFFLGIGIRALSVEVASLSTVQRVAATVTIPEAEAYANALLATESIAEAQALLGHFV